MASNANAGGRAQTRKPVKDLSPKDVKKVVGGKAGATENPYLTIKLTEVLVSQV
jgi:hypothetical protein